jgi:hypothetical protein
VFCSIRLPVPLNMREWFVRRRPLRGKSASRLRCRPGANLPVGSPRGALHSLNLAVSPSAACSPKCSVQVPHASAKWAACPSAISTPVCAVSSPRHQFQAESRSHGFAITARRLRVMLVSFDALLERRQHRTPGSTCAKLSAHWRTPSLWKW